MNKDGAFQRTARFRGPDLDSASESELLAATARLNNALKRLGSGWALGVEAARRPAAAYPVENFPDALSLMVDEERRSAFESAGTHFESAYHLTLVWLPPPESRARATQWLFEQPARASVDWREQLAAFVTATDRLLSLLESALPEVQWLTDAETLTYLHACVSNTRHPVAVPEVPFHLDALLADAPLAGGLEPDARERTPAGADRAGLSGVHLAGTPR